MIIRASLALILLLLCGAVQAQTRLQPSDTIRVLCEEDPTVSADYQLDRQGNATINLVGKLNLAGLLEAEAARLISQAIEKRGLQPKATVTVKLLVPKNGSIRYAGAVMKAGEIACRTGLRLRDVVIAAEPTEAADMKVVRITSRDGAVLVVDTTATDSRANPELRPGDHVFFPLVERAQEVYVLGGVKSPGRVAYRLNLTVNEVIEACGGPLPHANVWRAKVVKVNGEEWPLDLSGQGSDIPLEPGDTVVVPLVDRQRYVTVIGAVAKPGIIELQFGMNLTRAIEVAGGLLPEADSNSLNVTRRMGEKYTPNAPLQPYDVIDVPYRRDKGAAVVQFALRMVSFLTVFGR